MKREKLNKKNLEKKAEKWYLYGAFECSFSVEKMLTNQWFAFVNSDYLLQFCGHYNQIQNLTSQNGLIQFFHSRNCY